MSNERKFVMPSLQDFEFEIFYSKKDNPLESFYIPALSASICYDRSAGYFSSSSLAVAAAGVARLIQNGGRMRLLVGAELSETDVDAIQRGHDLKQRIEKSILDRFPDPQDALLKARLEVLAWMVAEGTLELKIVLPSDENGMPIPANQTRDYYHAKSGIFTDTNGDQMAFSGSINESETGWKHNYEQFLVYFSWTETAAHLKQVTLNFDRLWDGQEPDWIAVDVPQAVQERLLKYRPTTAPVRDPLEREPALSVTEIDEKTYISGSPQAERLLFQFIRDAPYLPTANELGATTSAITPWPHQSRVSNSLLTRFPERALLCDEVGLGKTIEAGLVLRQLLISGWIQRCLILVPKSVLKQWQEELYEKFALEIPRYDSGRYWDVDDHPLPIEAPNPWDACPIMLASSQLAKRSERRSQILDASGWDLLIVDEAHHARRKDFKEPIYRPNQLLGLLNDFKHAHKVSSVMLMTATPMQIHPLEVWDLLSVVGLGGRWGADEENYLAFFSEMRKSFNLMDWEFVFDMVRDYMETGGEIETTFKEQVVSDIGPVKWSIMEELPFRPGQRKKMIKQMGTEAQPYIKELAKRHTPLNHFIYRNTRELLREYEKRGILKAQVPKRKPRIERVNMLPEEQALYDRIDEYITHFYHKYENERRGLGFVMTVYRRRLTSSFYAVRCSLERRLGYLEGQLDPESVFDNDDLEQDELDLDISEEVLDPVQREYFQAEVDYVKDFIQQLKLLSVTDSKIEELKDELNQTFRQRSKVLIFTQYTDTMDYLREQLQEVYGSQVACYSGRGGEVWNGIAWVQTTKEEVKNEFREGNIRILLGTESASEGLNLQTCGVLINYDMPWNPMRVEQRIGRIDRIGQEYKEVWISNYFYAGTIEDQIYQRLADRIDWFEVVVGDLQPILAEIGEATRRLAMLPPTEREAQLEQEIVELRQRIDNRNVESLNLDDYLEVEEIQAGPSSPVTLDQLQLMLTQSQATGHLFQPHPEIEDAYLLKWDGNERHVTFSPQVFDEHPDTVLFLSYGSPLLAEVLTRIPDPEITEQGQIVRNMMDGEFELRSWFALITKQAQPTKITNFLQLKDWFDKCNEESQEIPDSMFDKTRKTILEDYSELKERREQILKNRKRAIYLTQRVKAQNLLKKAAMVEIAVGRNPEIFDIEAYPTEFNKQAIENLQRHGYPWTALLKLAYDPGIKLNEESTFYQRIVNDSRESLKGRFAQLAKEARENVPVLNNAEETQKGVISDEPVEVITRTYM